MRHGMHDETDPRPDFGFTLIEMVVVIGIIILATGFIVPSLSKFFQNRQLNNAGKIITNTLQEARNEAVTKKQPVRVIFLQRGLRVYVEGPVRIGRVHAYTGGCRSLQSAIFSRVRATSMSRSSRSGAATSCTPIGSPDALVASGREIAG